MTAPTFAPVFNDGGATLFHGDCIDIMRTLPDNSVDSVVTDPPYALEFMGREWDGWNTLADFQAWCTEWAREALRVLKPGGHIVAFGGSRTWHRLASGIEDAGFEIRDSIAWLYGSGFPKSMDVSKAIDKTRDDSSEVLAVSTRLAELAEAAGITRRQVDAAMGTSDMGGWWLSRIQGRAAVASIENWTRLRALIPGAEELDAEVLRLNGRKGEAGEAWAAAEVLGVQIGAASGWNMDGSTKFVDREIKAPNSDAARAWEGWGTALKPAFEPIVVGRKPFPGTVVANVLAYGTGALNIDACRIPTGDSLGGGSSTRGQQMNGGWRRPWMDDPEAVEANAERSRASVAKSEELGRWPANVLLDKSQAAALDEQTGVLRSGMMVAGTQKQGKASGILGEFKPQPTLNDTYGDEGGASRFFPTFRYEAKAPTSERPVVDGVQHPTVKPLELMRWLCRLVTRPGGVILEPFSGSGTTLEAALLEGFEVIGCELTDAYIPLIVQRLTKPLQVSLFGDWEVA